MLEIPQYPNLDNCFYITSAGKMSMYECVPISYINDSIKIKGETRFAISVTFNLLNASYGMQCVKTFHYTNNEWVSADKQFFTNIIDAIWLLERQVTFKNEAMFKDVVKQFSKKYPEILL